MDWNIVVELFVNFVPSIDLPILAASIVPAVILLAGRSGISAAVNPAPAVTTPFALTSTD